MSTYTFQWTHPDMADPVDVSIGYDTIWRSSNGNDYEEMTAYVDAIYVGNVDITPMLSVGTISEALEAYYQDLKDEQCI